MSDRLQMGVTQNEKADRFRGLVSVCTDGARTISSTLPDGWTTRSGACRPTKQPQLM